MSEWALAGIFCAGVGLGLILSGQWLVGGVIGVVGLLCVAGSEAAKR